MKRDNQRCVSAYLVESKLEHLKRHKNSLSKSIRRTIDSEIHLIEFGKKELYKLSLEQLTLLVKELKNISIDPTLIGTLKTILKRRIRNTTVITTLSRLSELGIFALLDYSEIYHLNFKETVEKDIKELFNF